MKHLLLSLILFISYNLSAQPPAQSVTIKGVIIDSAGNKPLGFATLILREAETAVFVKSLLTKADGTFEFTVPANKQYNISVAFVGYLPKIVKIPLPAPGGKTAFDLWNIALAVLQSQLKEVSIIAERPILTQQIDRISFDVQADPESKADDALEMLKKVPMVTVDGNDIIQLKGSGSYQIFINGKPSALMANNPSDVLKAMPAAVIKKIEVITVPPSKYDAEGLVGIINIITLKNNDDGIKGSAFARFNSVFGERGSLSLALKTGKLGINTFFGLGRQPQLTTAASSQLTTYSPLTNLSQQGRNTDPGHFNNGQVQLSYELDSLNLFTASMDFVNRKFAPNSFRYSQFFTGSDSLTQSYRLNNIGKNVIGAFDLGLNYQLGFKQNKNELLTLSWQYSSTSNNQTNAVSTTDRFNYSSSDYDQQNSSGSKEHTFQLDFIKPVQKLIIEAGAKAIFRNNFSNFDSENFDPLTGQYLADTSQTNQFSYHQNVYSVYNSYQLNVTNWIFKAGLRAENTDINGTFVTSTAAINQHYLNLIPAISIQRNYRETGSFTLGFTERIERPGIKQLNPFVDRSDPEFIVTGNPSLRPVLNHIFELSYSKFAKVSFNTSLNYAFANNTVQSVTSLISDTVSKTTYLNVGKTQSAGINLSTNYPIADKLIFNTTAQIAHLWITGIYNAQFYKNNGNQGNISAFLRYNFDNDLNVSLGYSYFSESVFLQGRSSDFVSGSLVIIKDFLHKKATFSLTIYNPFKQYHNNSSYTNTPDFEQSTFTQEYYRNLRLAFNYKFGKLKADIKNSHRSINNDDVKQDKGSEN